MGENGNSMNQGFTPIDLNEKNIQIIFRTCLAREEDADKNNYKLFRKEMGFEATSAPIFFSQKRLGDHFKSIFYLCGQIKSIHSGSYRISPAAAAQKYTGEPWTKNQGNVAALLLLIFASGLCSHFRKENAAVYADFLQISAPTLSPNDPNFPEWWEAHKSEWA